MNLNVAITTGCIDHIYDPMGVGEKDDTMYLFMDLLGHRIAMTSTQMDSFKNPSYVCVGLLDMKYGELVSNGVRVKS